MIRKSVSDYPLVILALLLSAYGIAVVYSAGQTDFPVAYIEHAWKRQLAWFALSLGFAYFLFRRSSFADSSFRLSRFVFRLSSFA